MRKLSVFNSVSLDGYFTDSNSDNSFAHTDAGDPELVDFIKGNAQGKNVLVFGRVTYDEMVKWWPTPAATQAMPEIAKGMNDAPKIVFSRTLKKSDWEHTTVLSGDPAQEIAKIKQTDGPDLTVLGSGQIVAQLEAAGLFDSLQLLIVPVILGAGKSQFFGVKQKPWWKVARSKTFNNGRVFVAYERKP
jgi:dihydrofolate reductase